MSNQAFVSVYGVCSVSTGNILCGYVECSVLYEGAHLQLTIHGSWC
jgi:hypothetical protein